MTASLHDENVPKNTASQGSLPPEQPFPHFTPNSSSYSKFLAPGPTYIAPSSSFFFSSGQNSASLIDFLPSKPIADRLLDQYWLAVNPLCRAVHKPSFLRRYSSFWVDVEAGIEPPGSVQAVVFAALFSGVVSMPDEAVLMQFGTTKKDLVENFQMGTETALGRANVIRTTKVETLQALVMYMVGLPPSDVILRSRRSSHGCISPRNGRCPIIPYSVSTVAREARPRCLTGGGQKSRDILPSFGALPYLPHQFTTKSS